MDVGLRLRGGAQGPVAFAKRVLEAEDAHLDFVAVADDVRLPRMGVAHASSIWPVLGGIAATSDTIQVRIDGIPITGPTHPASVAHLAITSAAMMPGRFSVGFSAGSVDAPIGGVRPNRSVRLRALTEGVDVFRRLVRGERVNQQEGGLVINDLQLSGGRAEEIDVSITATDDTEAALAAELGCDLVIPLGVDVRTALTSYRNAGGAGGVSAAILVADPDDPESLETARLMLADRADVNVQDHWVDPSVPDKLTEAMLELAELGVSRLELASSARDPRVHIAQWRAFHELLESHPTPTPSMAGGSTTDAAPIEPRPPVAEPVDALIS